MSIRISQEEFDKIAKQANGETAGRDYQSERLELDRQRLELAKAQAEARERAQAERIQWQREQAELQRIERERREARQTQREQRERRGWLLSLALSVGLVLVSVVVSLIIIARY